MLVDTDVTVGPCRVLTITESDVLVVVAVMVATFTAWYC